MHRMNANRVTDGGTSTLNDGSIRRIEAGFKQSKSRRTKKRQASIQKTANKKTVKVSSDDTLDTTKRIVVASLDDIPVQFERIGTGFFREGHHLWEMFPGKGGFVLTRKHGEDHVLDYDPEPIKKESAIFVTDRFGNELKQGNRVRFPVHGKVATGTIILLTPGGMDVGLDNGDTASYPPGMAELIEEVAAEDHENDKDAGGAFEPDVNDKATSDYVGPQSAQTGGIGGVAADFDDDDSDLEVSAKKTAQTDQGTQTVTQIPESPTDEPSYPSFDPSQSQSRLAMELDNTDAIAIMTDDGLGPYLISNASGGQYKIESVKMDKVSLATVDVDGLFNFEEQLGSWNKLPGLANMARTSSRDITLAVLKDMARVASTNTIDISSWKEYWQSVGERVAQAAPKTPQPKMTDEEKKQKRKERRKQREVERSALPKGTKLPPKMSAKDTDERAKLKEIIKILESGYDELEYSIDNIDSSDPNADALAADAVAQVLERISEERGELEEGEREEMENELSLDMPSQLELGEQIKTSSKIVMSMSDL